MRFRVLGPVETENGGRWLAPGPPKQRAALAVLLLNAGRTVSIEMLTEVLWGQRAPRSAAKNLQVYIWRLRGLVGDRLQSKPSGYCLTVAPDELDLAAFDQLTDQARQACKAGDLAGASDRLTKALALWRGPALADVVVAGMACALAGQLDAQRLRAIHKLVEVDLSLGRNEELTVRLAEWVVDHPLDEALREHQMALLLDAGRPAEALAAYRAAEVALTAGLGVRPGSALDARARQARRLMSDGDLTGMHDPVRQLPPASPMFVGRRHEIAHLHELLTPRVLSVPIVGLAGPGGVGKSALAIRVGHQLAASFPDGQLYLDLQGATPGATPMLVSQALRHLLVGLGVGVAAVPPEITDATQLYRSSVAGRRVLVVLDNAADCAQVRPLIPGSGGSAVLLTARRSLAELDGITQIHLQTLPTTDAIDLLTQIVGPDRVARESTRDLAKVAAACAGLPLALRLAGARLASRPSWSIRTLRQLLTDEHRRLSELRIGDSAVRTSLAVSYDSLSDQARMVFRCCGLHPGVDFTGQAVAVLADAEPAEADRLLEDLVDAALLQAGPDRYRLHDLIRIFAVERTEAEDRDGFARQAFARLAHWYLASADRADHLLLPDRGRLAVATGSPQPPAVDLPDAASAAAWFEAERANLCAVVSRAAQLAMHEIAWQLALITKGFLSLRSYTDDLIAVHQVGLASARSAGDQGGEARMLNGLGHGYWHLERFEQAADYYRQALGMLRAAQDLPSCAAVLNNLGAVYGEAGDVESAISCLREALDIRRQFGGLIEESFALNNLGHILHVTGRLDEALKSLERALEIRCAQGSRRSQAVTLHCLADTLLDLGRHDDAAAAIDTALTVFEEKGDRYGAAAALHTLGRLRAAQQRRTEAVNCLRRAVAGYHDLGCRRDETRARTDLRMCLDSAPARRTPSIL